MTNATVVLLFILAVASLTRCYSFQQQSSTPPQCQCVTSPTPSTCMGYDSRYQAATLEEAMASFQDLSMDQPPTTLEEDAACTTQDCLDCQSDLHTRLEQVGLIAPTGNETTATSFNNSTCTKYSFSSQDSYNGTMEAEDDDDEKESNEEHEECGHSCNRPKRQITTTTPPTPVLLQNSSVVGTRYSLSCTPKGTVTDASGMVSLCTACWVWRKLPDNYSPQYVNELVCDDTDNSCLSGYASCSVGNRAIEVVRNDSGILTTVAMNAGSYCECRVAANSALQPLVQGNTSTPLPPLPSSPQHPG